MEGGRELFDASSYMLIEASGDSEADDFDKTVEVGLDFTAAEDDAQSCSCGSLSDSVAVHEIDAGGEEFHGLNFDDSIEEEDDDCDSGGGEVEDGVVDQCCGGGKAVEELNKLKACEDSNRKLMNDGEMDRLFWEACLAS